MPRRPARHFNPIGRSSSVRDDVAPDPVEESCNLVDICSQVSLLSMRFLLTNVEESGNYQVVQSTSGHVYLNEG